MPEKTVGIGAVLSSTPWEGFKPVGELSKLVAAKLPMELATRTVLMTYAQELHILDSRDTDKSPYTAGRVIEAIPHVLAQPAYFGIQEQSESRVDFAVAAPVSGTDRHLMIVLKALKTDRSRGAADELLFVTGWDGREKSLRKWIRSHGLTPLAPLQGGA